MNNDHGNGDDPSASHVLIYGHGTLSGDKLPHPSYNDPPLPETEFWQYSPIFLAGNWRITL